MKPLQNITAIVIIGAVLFSRCKKDDTMAPSNPNPAAKNTTFIPGAQVNFELTTLPQDPNSLLLWNTGYITTSAIEFDGTHIVGNALHLARFPLTVQQTVKLFTSSMLGTVSVPTDQFDYASFTVTLAPLNQANALFLGGTFTMNNQRIPVQVIIDGQVTLTSVWIDNITLSQQNYLSNLFLDMGQLTNGITANTLANAQMTNGTILISANSNSNLYEVVLNNLQTGLKVQFNMMAPPPATGNPSPIAISAQGAVR